MPKRNSKSFFVKIFFFFYEKKKKMAVLIKILFRQNSWTEKKSLTTFDHDILRSANVNGGLARRYAVKRNVCRPM